ncbi:hypothetical protein F5Y18DRAFT_26013 [Xylariaceae sp. FL1019]|nr:hypothetical protein F5Y18DRAFT_26013 [Xylariaceae sp. FL1019]
MADRNLIAATPIEEGTNFGTAPTVEQVSTTKAMEAHAGPRRGPDSELITFTTPLDWLSRFAGISYFVPLINFEPSPNAPFEEEFRRWASALSLTYSEWRVQRTRAIDRELVYHYFTPTTGRINKSQVLKGYQDMMRATGREPSEKDSAEDCRLSLVLFEPPDVIGFIDFKRTGRPMVDFRHTIHNPRSVADAGFTTLDYQESKVGSGILLSLFPDRDGRASLQFRLNKGKGSLPHPPWWNSECKLAYQDRKNARKSGTSTNVEEHGMKAAVRRAKRAYNEKYGETFKL